MGRKTGEGRWGGEISGKCWRHEFNVKRGGIEKLTRGPKVWGKMCGSLKES